MIKSIYFSNFQKEFPHVKFEYYDRKENDLKKKSKKYGFTEKWKPERKRFRNSGFTHYSNVNPNSTGVKHTIGEDYEELKT
jgi:hypothetical protein